MIFDWFTTTGRSKVYASSNPHSSDHLLMCDIFNYFNCQWNANTLLQTGVGIRDCDVKNKARLIEFPLMLKSSCTGHKPLVKPEMYLQIRFPELEPPRDMKHDIKHLKKGINPMDFNWRIE